MKSFPLIFATLILALPLLASAADQPPIPARPPNILWLIAEDIGTDLGCYGDPDARTPNLDRLASQGCLYREAHSTGPVCSTSRSAFITGMYQTSFGAANHRGHRDDGYVLPDGIRLITDRLREVGYFTANIKKLPAPIAWSAAGKTDWNFVTAKPPFDSAVWQDLQNHQPFYAQLNIHETHRIYEKAKDHPTDPDKVAVPPYLPDHPIAREDWALYHDSIQTLDAKVGQILDLLDKQGLADNTIVFFFGDHGRECFRGKYFSYEQGFKTSLLVRWPGHIQPGTSSDDLVSLIDVTATSLSLAGVPVPPEMHGRPFLGPNATRRRYLFTARDRIDETIDHVRTVRDDRYRYIRNYEPDRPYLQHMIYADHTNPNVNLMRKLYADGKLNADQARFMATTRPTEELYDLKSDPWEFHNLNKSADHRQILKRLRGVLDQWRKDTNDQGLEPEESAALQRILDKHERDHEKMFGDPKAKPTAP